MKKHEDSCTANPNRICNMPHCSNRPVSELVEALLSCDFDWDSGMKALRAAADDCPVCILAAIRQSDVQKHTNWDDENFGDIPDLKFNFKEEKEQFWKDYNSEHREALYNGYL